MLAPRNPYPRAAGLVAVVVVTAVASRLSVDLPMTSVPQTAQTLAVLGAGILFGCRWGAIAMGAYLLLGVSGLPVFAAGAAGVEHLLGPTGGYLVGFVAGAALAGWWVERGLARSLSGAFLGMAAAHATILILGWSRLALTAGVGAAWFAGVTPFLVGAGAKSLIAALAAVLISRRFREPESEASSEILDRLLPRFDVAKHYELRIEAPSEVVWEALHRADFSRSASIRWLLRLRGLGRRRRGPLTLASFERARFAVLEEVPPRHIVLGLMGRFWRPTGPLLTIDQAAFLAGAPEGFARAAWSFELEADGEGATRLATETRVLASDERSRRSFLRYWRLVGPFSGVMRRSMLRQVEAEARSSSRIP